MIGLICVLVWLVSVFASQRVRRMHLFHLAAFGFTTWYCISTWWLVSLDGRDFRTTVLQSLVLTIMMWDLLRTKGQVQAAMQAYIVGGFVSTACTIKSYFDGAKVAPFEPRFTANGFDPNDLALLLVLGVPMAVYLATELGKQNPLRLAVNMAYPLAAVLVVLLTSSRGSIIAAVPVILFIVLSMGRLVKVAPGYLAVAGGVAIAVLHRMNLAASLSRLSTVTSSSSSDRFSGRANLWQGGWFAYGDHPWLGFGGGGYPTAAFPFSGYGEKLFAHETYLSVLTELGPIGVLLFGSVLVFVIRSAFRLRGRERLMWVSVMATWGIGVSALSWEFRSQTWLFFSLIMACAFANRPMAVVEIVEQESKVVAPILREAA
jgi:O-antigen ligase